MIDKIFKKYQSHYVNLFQKNFWNDGFVKLEIPKNNSKKKIFKKLNEVLLNTNNFKNTVKEKYKSKGIIDIREDEKFYDDFIDFLIDDRIIDKINFISCKKLVPIAIKIRINKYKNKKKNFFFNRHRDTFKKNNNIHGNIPPLINLHIYPTFSSEAPENQLKIWPGTHKKFFSNIIDKISIQFTKSLDMKTSNDNMLFFDTSIIHAIHPTQNLNGSIRCMYNFLDINQIHEDIEDFHLVSKWKNKIYGN
jgi:hypothetical protein